jgi:hypothetical protein
MTRYLLLFDSYGLFLWGDLSGERMGLTFEYAAGPCQRSFFSGPSPLGLTTIFYCLTFETSLSSPPMTCRITVEVIDPTSTRCLTRYSLSSNSYKPSVGQWKTHIASTVAWCRVNRLPSNNRCTARLLHNAVFNVCLATVVARALLLRDVTASKERVFTERCVMIGVGVRDVIRGNTEFTWPLLPVAPSTHAYTRQYYIIKDKLTRRLFFSSNVAFLHVPLCPERISSESSPSNAKTSEVYMVHHERSYWRVIVMWIFEKRAPFVPGSDK